MPSTNTITAFHTFNAATPAKSSEVNNNFSIFRGSLIPIDTATQTASDLTHNVGSLTHRWLGSWHKEWSGATAGSTFIVHGGETSTAFTNISDGVTFDGSDPGVGGICHLSLTGGIYERSSVGASSVALIAGSTATLSTLGKPVFYNFITSFSQSFTTTAATPGVYVLKCIKSPSITVGSINVFFEMNMADQSSNSNDTIQMPIDYRFIDRQPGQTANTYYMKIEQMGTFNTSSLGEPQALVYELK